MPTLYNKQTRLPEALDGEAYKEAIRSGTHAFKAGQRVNFADPSGESVNIAAEDVSAAIAAGYNPLSPTDEVVQRYVDDNKGLKGALKVGLGQLVDEAAMGLPELIYDKTGDPLEVAKKEALKKEHGFANTLGGLGGFATSLLYGAPIFKGVGKVGEKATEMVASRLATKAGEEVGKRTLTKAATEILKDMTAKGVGSAAEGGLLSLPHAITEYSLGDPQDAAETLMSGLGMGAILGSGGVLAKELMGSVSKKVASSLSNKEGLDNAEGMKALFKGKAEEKAVESLNPILSQMERLENSKDPKLLGRFLIDEGVVTPFASRKDMYERLVQKTDEIGAAQGALLQSFDDRIMNEGITDALIDPTKIVDDLKISMMEKHGDKGAYQGALESFFKQLDNVSQGKTWTIAEANKQKSAWQDVVKTYGFDKSVDKKFLEEIPRAINKTVKDKVKTHFGQDALDQLEDLNKRYGYLEEAEKIAKKSAARDAKNNDIGLTSFISGGIGAATFGAPGAVIGLLGREGTRRYGNQIQSALYDNMGGLLFAEKAMKRVAEKLDDIPHLLNRMGEKAPPPRVIGNEALFRIHGDSEESPGRTQDLIRKRMEKLEQLSKKTSEWVANPEALSNKVAQITSPISSGGAPDIGQALNSKMINGLNYLNTQMPKPPKPLSPFARPVKFRPSDHAMAEFEQKLNVVEDPFIVLDELHRGTLTKNHMDALDAVYPGIARMVREKISQAAVSNPRPLDYSKRLKLSLVLGQPLDESVSPQSIQYYQQTYAGPDQGAQAEAMENGTFKGDVQVSAPMLTDTQRIAAKTL